MTVTRPHEDRLGTDGATDYVLSWTGTGTAQWRVAGGPSYLEDSTVNPGQPQFISGVFSIYEHNGASFVSVGFGTAQLEAAAEMYLGVASGAVGGAPTHIMYGGSGLVLPLLTADPAGGNSTEGQMYGNTTSHKLRYYNGSAWVDAT